MLSSSRKRKGLPQATTSAPPQFDVYVEIETPRSSEKKPISKRRKAKKGEHDVVVEIVRNNEEDSGTSSNANEPDLDITKTCPNEIVIHILSFLTYKEVLGTYFDHRWSTIGNSKEVWGMFCRRMHWKLPLKSKNMTFKDLFKRRITSKSYCSSCGCKTTAKFPLLQIVLCSNCRTKEPEFATLNKTQSKAEYCLDDFDLTQVHHVIANVGWGRKKYVFLKSDIIAAAIQKFGSIDGLNEERAKRNKKKLDKTNLMEQKKVNRAQELEQVLFDSNWRKTFAIGPRNFPILLPSELLNDDYDKFLRSSPKGNPTRAFASVFILNCARYLNTGFGALFIENMSLLDDIEAYFEKEKARNSTSDNPEQSSTTTTTTASTTTTTDTDSAQTPTSTTVLAASTDSTKTNDSHNTNNELPKVSKNGRPLTTYAGVSYDAELRTFYLNILYARIEQIWQHPGRYDIEPENVDEDDYMGVLFDKHSHFTKRLRTPNNILVQIYNDALTVIFGDDATVVPFDISDSSDNDSDSASDDEEHNECSGESDDDDDEQDDI